MSRKNVKHVIYFMFTKLYWIYLYYILVLNRIEKPMQTSETVPRTTWIWFQLIFSVHFEALYRSVTLPFAKLNFINLTISLNHILYPDFCENYLPHTVVSESLSVGLVEECTIDWMKWQSMVVNSNKGSKVVFQIIYFFNSMKINSWNPGESK